MEDEGSTQTVSVTLTRLLKEHGTLLLKSATSQETNSISMHFADLQINFTYKVTFKLIAYLD